MVFLSLDAGCALAADPVRIASSRANESFYFLHIAQTDRSEATVCEDTESA